MAGVYINFHINDGIIPIRGLRVSEGCQGPIRGNTGEFNPYVLSYWPYGLSESTFALVGLESFCRL